jgi:hypothetical protein
MSSPPLEEPQLDNTAVPNTKKYKEAEVRAALFAIHTV